MRTRRSWKNQDRLFNLLFRPQGANIAKKKRLASTRTVPVSQKGPAGIVRDDYVAHYHQDDSGIFECPLGDACRYRVNEAEGFEKVKE